VPILAVFVAKGIMELMKIKTIIAYGLLTVSFFFMLAFGWYEVRGYYNINNPAIVEAGKEVDKLTEPEALVIAPYRGDTAFLYQTNRKGWPIGGNIDQRITQGADYYVTTAMDDEAKELMERCEVVSQTDSYLIVSLHKCDE
jgi:hypothetical protein